jgi:GTP pyrophosphokinase
VVFKTLVKKILRYNKNSNITLIEKAYIFAKNSLFNKKRSSGKEEIKHNLEVALLLAEIKSDDVTIVAGLLHNVLDYGVSSTDIISIFGDTVASILEATKKGGVVSTNKYTDASSFRKMLMASICDPRVLLIKLTDKISSLRDLSCINDEERKRDTAKEALNIYAPIAHKLGLGVFKEELEDLSFEVLEPKLYNEIVVKLKETKKERSIVLHRTRKILIAELSKEGIQAEVQGRTKHIYSIYKKVVTRSYDLGAMKDLIGIRVITNSLEDCYNILRIIHQLWTPVKDTFKNYIAMPKPNGYQSLHLVVFGPDNKLVEFQIRTREMHEYAEEGLASHSSYKGIMDTKFFDRKLYWLKEALNEISNEKVIDTRTINLFEEKIYVLTPKKDVIELPRRATVLDFAYAIHSTLGSSAVGAYVNDKYVTLRTEVKNGDCVKIITQKGHKPSMEWMNFVVTGKAKEKIRSALKKLGKLSSCSNVVGGDVDISFLVDHKKKKNLPVVQHLRCNPLPFDNIILEVDNNRDVIVLHKSDCLKGISVKNRINGCWRQINNREIVFEINCIDKVGLFSDILHIFSSMCINIESATAETKGDVAICFLKMRIKDSSEMSEIISLLRRLKEIRAIILKKPI